MVSLADYKEKKREKEREEEVKFAQEAQDVILRVLFTKYWAENEEEWAQAVELMKKMSKAFRGSEVLNQLHNQVSIKFHEFHSQGGRWKLSHQYRTNRKAMDPAIAKRLKDETWNQLYDYVIKTE